jgi:hypothetical protein
MLLSFSFTISSFGYIETGEQLSVYPDYLAGNNLDSILYWETSHNDSSTIQLIQFKGQNGDGLQVNYILNKDPNSSAWVTISCNSITGFTENTPVTMLIKADATGDIELKFTDEDGSVFLKRYPIENMYKDWTQIVVYLKNTSYAWGGDKAFGKLSKFEISFSAVSQGSGTVWIDEIGLGKEGIMPGFFLDPFRESTGSGFYQRRSDNATPEDTLVLRYLKILQDYSSADARVLPNQEGSDLVSTFNSSLATMAFLIKNQKERAERILDFYASAVDPGNLNIEKQNFYFNGEPRGFYQQMSIKNYNRGGSTEDRWIGDMAWLLIAYRQYEQKYGVKPLYTNVVNLLRDLIISFYKNTGNDCGCVQVGWQDGDTRFDTTCHDEGNIDCYAALKACGEVVYSQKIRNWVNKTLTGYDRPLDNYTWRVLALGDPTDTLLRIPEFDFRYRKKVVENADSVYGFYTYPDISVNNIWTEGIGHMACSQYYSGNEERGNFYSNQFDPLLLEYNIYGKSIKTLPYAINRSGEFTNLDTTKGNVSSASWYIFAKNKLNPLQISIPDKVSDVNDNSGCKIYPNPVKGALTIESHWPGFSITICSYDGIVKLTSVSHNSTVTLDMSNLMKGIYMLKLQYSDNVIIRKLIKQ